MKHRLNNLETITGNLSAHDMPRESSHVAFVVLLHPAAARAFASAHARLHPTVDRVARRGRCALWNTGP
ncbi:MAG: hypothetical protein JNJ50_17195 [Acidobacteria bacterium]|nr:hypothetical protein [Acidobacteriota bacterium]